jgi:hypothetical protein
MGDAPKANAEKAKRWRHFEEFRRNLILELFLQRGPFWEAVREARRRNGITATISVPPPDFNLCVQQHPHDVLAILEKVIPTGLRETFTIDWQGFIQACLLHDPPDHKLTEFDRLWAEPLPSYLVPRGGSKHLQRLAAPPIREMRDPAEVRRYLTSFYEDVIDALIDTYLVPAGFSKEEVRRSLQAERPELWDKLEEEEEANTQKPYIVVDEFTTQEDVKWAFSKIHNSNGQRAKSPGTGRPARDPLVAVECAILHDRYGWTYAQLAERYGWDDPNVASKYIDRGRTITRHTGLK